MEIILVLLISFLAAIIPTCFYIVIAWWFDRYEKEPVWLLIVTFLWGAVPAIILSLIGELLLDIPLQLLATGQGADLISSAVIAPVVEEAFKAIPLLIIFFLYRREFDGLMDGLLYGSLVGFGFSMTENALYFLGAYTEGGWAAWSVLVFLRAIIFGLNHALFTSAIGVGLAYARYTTNGVLRVTAPLLGLGAAIVLHGIHNFFVSFPDAGLLCLVSLIADWLGVILWLALVYFSTRKEKQWITEELVEEVATGLLPREHAIAAARYRTRLRDRWATFQERGFGPAHRLSVLHNSATELALKKRQFQIHGDERGNQVEIERLRGKIAQMIAELA